MSANYILEYAGAPVRFTEGSHAIELVEERFATPFLSDGDALKRAFDARLNLNHCEVVNTHLRDQQTKRDV